MPPPTAGRTIGRILSLGYPLPGPLVDNYTFISAPAFFDYDALVVEIAAVSALLEGVISGDTAVTSFTGAPVRTKAAAPGDVSLRDLLTQRRDEAAMLLDRGGIIVAFASPGVAHRIDDAGPPLDDYCWLPDDIAALCRAPALHPSAGTRAHIVDFHHPLAAFVHSRLAHVAYTAYIDTAAVPASHVFARSEGGAAIAAELPASSGRVVMLPAMKAPPAGDARYAASDALQAGIRYALGAMAPGREPPWAAAYTLPGLDDRTAALDAARADLDRAQAQLDESQRAHDELARYRRLLWQEGALGLHDVLLDALRLLGFQVYASDPNAIELRYDDTTLLLEIAASERPVDLDAHYRLRQRIEDAIAQRKSTPRGLLVVNGRRLAAPAERADEVTPALRAAAETMRYGIATTAGLFAAVAAALAHDDAAVSAYRCRLLRDEGLIE